MKYKSTMEAFPGAVYQDGDHMWLSLTTGPPCNQSLLSSEPCLFNATDLSSLGPFINVDTQRVKKKKKDLRGFRIPQWNIFKILPEAFWLSQSAIWMGMHAWQSPLGNLTNSSG